MRCDNAVQLMHVWRQNIGKKFHSICTEKHWRIDHETICSKIYTVPPPSSVTLAINGPA